MMRRIAIGCLAVLLAGMAAPARAELVIYAQDTTVNSGGYGYLNIYLAGEPTDLFDTYQVTLSITPMSPAVGTVVFAPVGAAPNPTNAASGEQPFSYLYPSGSTASNYIFANDSLDSTAGVNGGLQPSGYASTYFTITDLSLSGSEYAPSSTGAPTLADPGTLLASLLIQAVSTSPLEQYSVNLVSNGSGGIGDTFFTNSGNSVGYSPTLGSAPNFSGTITISSVPEPAPLVTGMTALLILASVHGVRRLRRSSKALA